jgi:hypothetical protein
MCATPFESLKLRREFETTFRHSLYHQEFFHESLPYRS